jgi:hypothetical protein
VLAYTFIAVNLPREAASLASQCEHKWHKHAKQTYTCADASNLVLTKNPSRISFTDLTFQTVIVFRVAYFPLSRKTPTQQWYTDSMDNAALPSSNSIWCKVSRLTFENNIDELATYKTYVPGARDYTRVAEHDSGDSRTLPLELERRLADDFAFISSSDFGVRHVPVATIGQCMGYQGLVLRLAANEGIDTEIYQEISKILRKLELCSTKRSGAVPADYMVAD